MAGSAENSCGEGNGRVSEDSGRHLLKKKPPIAVVYCPEATS
jgi:hypothetical protein